MKKYELVIFDVDGTLLDTTEGVLASVQYTIDAHTLPKLSSEDLQMFIGPPIQNSFKKFYSFDDERNQTLAETFRNRYKEHDLLKAVPYNNIYEVLDFLRNENIKIAVATYKRQDYAVEILKHFNFDKYTDILYGADNFNKLKKKDIIKKCIEDSAVEKYENVLMIGDSDNDAIGAEEIGVDFLGVTYGFGFKTKKDIQAYQAVGSADNPLEIIKFFKGEK